MNIEKIQFVAAEVRREFEQNAVSLELLTLLYQQYHPLEDIAAFLLQAQKMFPALNCGVASVFLKHRLQLGEILQGRYGNEAHTFLLIEDKIIVDVTADQYGGPSVYVGSLQVPWITSKS